jgi:hypothetical protein
VSFIIVFVGSQIGFAPFGLLGPETKQTKRLFKIVESNNTLLIDLGSKLHVIDRKRPGDPA